MIKITKIILFTLTVILLTGCYDRDIIDRKDFHHTLPKVENLSYSLQGNVVTLTWQIPDNISDAFTRPLQARVQVVENDIYRQVVTVYDEQNRAEITIDPAKDYRFIVKLLGFLTPDAREEGLTDRVFSEGEIIVTE